MDEMKNELDERVARRLKDSKRRGITKDEQWHEKVVETKEEPKGPNFAQILSTEAMAAYTQGFFIDHVTVEPFHYVTIVEALGQHVDFQALYGNVPVNLYGLRIFVRPDDEGQPWSEDRWFRFYAAQQVQQQPFVDDSSLLHKVVKTFETCQTQCERGYGCPLLVVVGKDMADKAMDACSALRDVETAMSSREDAIEAAITKFELDNEGDEG